MKKIALLLMVLMASSVQASVIDFTTLGSGTLPGGVANLSDATITNTSGGNLYGYGAENGICALSPNAFNCEADLEIDFVNEVGNLSFDVRGYNYGDSAIAYIYDELDNLLSSLNILANGNYGFGAIAGISRLVLDDSSTGAGYSYHDVTYTASVPEPGSLALLGLGLAGLGLARRKQRA